jgi:hypothetical protein
MNCFTVGEKHLFPYQKKGSIKVLETVLWPIYEPEKCPAEE